MAGRDSRDTERGPPGREISSWAIRYFDAQYMRSITTVHADRLDRVPHEVEGIPLTNISRQLWAFWLGARREGERMTGRAAFSISGARRLMPYVSIMSRRSPDELIYDVCATTITESFGGSLKGQNAFDYGVQALRHESRERQDWIQRLPCGMVAMMAYPNSTGETRAFQSLNLPVGGGDLPQIVACISADLETFNRHEMVQRTSAAGLSGVAFLDLGYGLPPPGVGGVA